MLRYPCRSVNHSPQVATRCGKMHSGVRIADWTDDWECVQQRISQHYDSAAVSVCYERVFLPNFEIENFDEDIVKPIFKIGLILITNNMLGYFRSYDPIGNIFLQLDIFLEYSDDSITNCFRSSRKILMNSLHAQQICSKFQQIRRTHRHTASNGSKQFGMGRHTGRMDFFHSSGHSGWTK